MRKRLFSLFMSVAMVVGLISTLPVMQVGAAGGVYQKFQSNVLSVHPAGSTGANDFRYAGTTTCHAVVSWATDVIFGQNIYQGSTSNIGSNYSCVYSGTSIYDAVAVAKCGDVFRYEGYNKEGKYTNVHSSLFISDNGSTATMYEREKTQFKLNSYDKSKIMGYCNAVKVFVYHANNYNEIDGGSAPDAPQLSINTKSCTPNDTVIISWPVANRATSYWLHIYKDGNDYINQTLNGSLSYSAKYPKGKYTAYIVACNAYGETLSSVNFTVFGDNPGKPSLEIDKVNASINDTVTIKWKQASNTVSYWLHTYKDGNDYENKSLGTSLSYSKKYPKGEYTSYIVSCNPYGETLNSVKFTVYGDNPGEANLSINKTSATPDDNITITWEETSNTEHYWLHIYKDHETYENKSLGKELSYSNKFPVGQYKAYIVPMNPYGETLSYVEFTISEQPTAELKYQLRQNNDSTDVRFILVADEQAVINADSASVYATIDDYGDTDSIVIKRAYRSIKAGGKTITADEGKVFLIGKFIGIPDDMINGMVGHFTLGENTYERTITH